MGEDRIRTPLDWFLQEHPCARPAPSDETQARERLREAIDFCDEHSEVPACRAIARILRGES